MVSVSDRLGVYRRQHQGVDCFFVVVGPMMEFTWSGQVVYRGQYMMGY